MLSDTTFCALVSLNVFILKLSSQSQCVCQIKMFQLHDTEMELLTCTYYVDHSSSYIHGIHFEHTNYA